MMGRFLRAVTWAWFGASIGYLAIGIVALYVNTYRYEHNVTISVEDASDKVARASGLPIGLILGAAYGSRSPKK